MLHGKWYKGVDDLTVLGRKIESKDSSRWHLHITQDGETVGYCKVMPGKIAWTIDVLEYNNSLALDLILRQVKRKAEEFSITAINCYLNEDLKVFGFTKIGENVMNANPIILPIYCKE